MPERCTSSPASCWAPGGATCAELHRCLRRPFDRFAQADLITTLTAIGERIRLAHAETTHLYRELLHAYGMTSLDGEVVMQKDAARRQSEWRDA